MANKVSVKHVQIDKSQSSMLAVVAISVALVIFSLFAIKALVVKGLYQKRALHARQQAAGKLKDNYNAANTLFSQYKVFASGDPNILGGSAGGSAQLDGNNAQIVLDALPSTYDAPALATSLEKILVGKNINIKSISVSDDPATNSDQPQAQPTTKALTFSFEGAADYKTMLSLFQDFEKSIRPFDVNTLEITGTDKTLDAVVGVTTYYQPARSLNLSATEVVK